jgi:aryl-alcohol dehydrogenase-like predicted oxidoreductase
VQVEYSPWSIDIEQNDILKTCEELGIAIVACTYFTDSLTIFIQFCSFCLLCAFLPDSPLGRGFLTGQFKSPEDFDASDYRKYNPRFQGEAFTKNLELVEALKKVAEKKGVSVTQLTLAWVMSQGSNIIPIPGTRKISVMYLI